MADGLVRVANGVEFRTFDYGNKPMPRRVYYNPQEGAVVPDGKVTDLVFDFLESGRDSCTVASHILVGIPVSDKGP